MSSVEELAVKQEERVAVNPTSDRILIRSDATTASGTGHVMRCLALGQQWMSNGGEVLFAQVETTPSLESKLGNADFSVIKLTTKPGTDEDAKQTTRLAQQHGAEWVVVDGYHFGGRYQQT